MVADLLAERAGASIDTRSFKGLLGRGRIGGEDVWLLKPQTYMNDSGQCVASVAGYYRIAPVDVVVVHDDMDLAFGRLRLKRGGGAGGHNGVRSIETHLGTADFVRVRIGVGRPAGEWGGERGKVVSHVLSPFSDAEAREVPQLVDRAAAAVEAVLTQSLQDAMNAFNRRDETSSEASP
jgi:PTH1 family peptidyl-tRNA hydrolase